MNLYSYNKGEKIAEMLYMKMFHVDVYGYGGNYGSHIPLDTNDRNTLNKLQQYHKTFKRVEDWDLSE